MVADGVLKTLNTDKPKVTMLKKIIYNFIFITVFITGCAQQTAYYTMLSGMYKNTVPLIEADEFTEILDSIPGIVLLDTREPEEFKVSHINGAIHVGYENFDNQTINQLSREEPVYVYCSVGYRSERIGEQLIEAGFKEVYNLYGGIFEWVNQGYPVVDTSGQQTEKIHAYSRSWGRWLIKGEKVYGR